MSLLVSRRGTIHRPGVGGGGGGGGFDPLSIAWHTAFWAEDPNWTPPGDGNAVSSWRNDGSGDWGDAAQATGANQPIYRSSVTALNNQPAVDFDGSDFLKTSAGTNEVVAMTTVMVADLQAPDASAHYLHDNRVQVGGDPSNNRLGVNILSTSQWRIIVDGSSGASPVGGSPSGGSDLLMAYFSHGGLSTLKVSVATAELAGNTGTNTIDGLTVGGSFSGGNVTGMRLAFLGLKIGALTDQEETDLLTWAEDHYGVDVELLASVGSWVTEVTNDTPTMWLRLGESSGTTATDEQGNHNGTYSGVVLGATGLIAGDSDTAAEWDTNSDYIEIADHADFEVNTFTFECWLKHDDPTVDDLWVVADKTGLASANNSWAIWYDNRSSQGSPKALRLFIDGTAVTWSGTDAENALIAGGHLVVIKEGGHAKIYWNAEAVAGRTVPNNQANALPLRIGQAANSTSWGWDGIIDDVVFYSGVALTGRQIARHHDAGSA